jgi:AAA15 family ATPase/GTPase
MSKLLVLKSLEVKRFRAFKHLRIEKLSRVNLIVGKNNVGKTSLLEAVWLFAQQGSPKAIWQMLDARSETGMAASQNGSRSEGQLLAISQLFHGRQDRRKDTKWSYSEMDVDKRREVSIGDGKNGIQIDIDLQQQSNSLKQRIIHVLIHKENEEDFTETGWDLADDIREATWKHDLPCVFVSAHGLSDSEIALLSDNATLQNRTEQVFESLRLISPALDRVDLVNNQQTQQRTLAVAKLAGMESRIPLRSLGEGMNRLFGLSLAISDSKDGILLVDEIDTGLHYSVLSKMWKLVFETARRLNVQVFATTHSKDCIEAFEQAMRQNNLDDGLVIKLHAKDNAPGEVEAIVIDKDILEVAVREDIEVRD